VQEAHFILVHSPERGFDSIAIVAQIMCFVKTIESVTWADL
jgi:hypothetical protein